MNDKTPTEWMETLAQWLDESAPSHARALRAMVAVVQARESCIEALTTQLAEAREIERYNRADMARARQEGWNAAIEAAAVRARTLYLFPPPTSKVARAHQRITQDAMHDAIRALASDGGGEG